MIPGSEERLFALLRLAFGAAEEDYTHFKVETAKEWSLLYSLASKLSVVGIAYAGVCKLPKDRRPPLNLALQWASEAEAIRGHNRLINAEAAHLTELFQKQGRRTAILKGAANARLYPDAFIRQCGDIDIWVDGGRETVVTLLQDLGMMAPEPTESFFFSHGKSREELYAMAKRKLAVSGHHVHLAQKLNGISIEVHFRPSSGNLNPLTNRRLQRYLLAELAHTELVPEGFYVPSLKFALAMQFSHIQRHFVAGGIGFKQVADYFVLLRNASASDREEFARQLRKFGFYRMCGALMWVLGYVFGLERERMLCAPDAIRGKLMLEQILRGGNFGYYEKGESLSIIPRWFFRRCRALRFQSFAPSEVIWSEVSYWKNFIRSIPYRIKLRKASIRELF
ncbi:nucleotidyltransferase family protein [Fibrobacter sp.]|uniref:nucleotidyltransferase domain-containing protein n=1 Tax=Fibrobacter sp. TaxID=35828 RepID=UPI0025BDC5E9|nr:nucleotidyltransferase family protein [Fibrobacter sp.]